MKLVVRGKTLNVFTLSNDGLDGSLRRLNEFTRCSMCMSGNIHGKVYSPLYTDEMVFVVCERFTCNFDVYV